jgi:hypothetical protein
MPPDSCLKKLSSLPSAENFLRAHFYRQPVPVQAGRHSVQTHLSLLIIRSALKRSHPATAENGITVSTFPKDRVAVNPPYYQAGPADGLLCTYITNEVEIRVLRRRGARIGLKSSQRLTFCALPITCAVLQKQSTLFFSFVPKNALKIQR